MEHLGFVYQKDAEFPRLDGAGIFESREYLLKRKLDCVVRQERSEDYGEVYDLVRLSFSTAPHGDGTEADYLTDLRKKDTFIPELSMVAVCGGRIAWQIVLSQTDIETPTGARTELLLSPVCVHPGYFRRYVATQMIETALAKAKTLGYRAVFLCGDPQFYRKAGFSPSCQYGLYHRKDSRAEWSMVRELYEGSLCGITGTINTN